MQPVRVRDTGKEGVARFIGQHGLVLIDFYEPNPFGRGVYDPEELDPIEPEKQESEGTQNE
jgi:hypothetical protein